MTALVISGPNRLRCVLPVVVSVVRTVEDVVSAFQEQYPYSEFAIRNTFGLDEPDTRIVVRTESGEEVIKYGY